MAVSSDAETIDRRGDSANQAGTIRANALMAGQNGRLVSAVRNAGGRLKLIGWRLSADGRTVSRAGDSGDAQTELVGLVRLAGETGHVDAPIVTCVKAENEDLRLISWDDQPAHGEVGLAPLVDSDLVPNRG
jgi:hypothetical protein